MKSSLTMFGIEIDIEVSSKKKRRKRKGAKALSAPRKDKMIKTSINK